MIYLVFGVVYVGSMALVVRIAYKLVKNAEQEKEDVEEMYIEIISDLKEKEFMLRDEISELKENQKK